jgi:NTP pyrophosphatase (non-canonical NTP hydrolase)
VTFERSVRMAEVLRDVIAERGRQDTKWGDQSGHADELWLTILSEEVGEAAKEVLDARFDNTWADLRKELVQVAAVVVAWIEAIDRRAET